MARSAEPYFDRDLHGLFHHALFHWNIAVTCLRCGHIRIFAGQQLWWLFERKGWDDRIGEVGKKLHCGACRLAGAPRGEPLRVERTKAAPTGEAMPEPTQRAWRRAVSRYRC